MTFRAWDSCPACGEFNVHWLETVDKVNEFILNDIPRYPLIQQETRGDVTYRYMSTGIQPIQRQLIDYEVMRVCRKCGHRWGIPSE
ncbi:hypothetical protein SEA_AEGEUS_69 [Mycobacterium phage Aegeus]|nr:hypothetical protein SEA_BAUDELAIRE_69 [Mycobacterium phage Baudelaire]WKW86561.1 hypothetical protein SEA_AEGEUS_69 [Mycobacterium phage Aegeus]